MKALARRLSEHRLLCIVLCVALVMGCCFAFLPKPCVLHLGIFAGSNWNVPGSDMYRIIDDAIARFEATHPGVKVEYESGIRKEDYSRWLSSDLLKGNLPDVFMVIDNDFPTLAKIDALHSLDGFSNGADGIDRSEYYEAALDGGTWNGTLYGLPFESNPQFMFVNLSLLEQEGVPVPDQDWTLDDLYAISRQITRDTDQDGRPDQFGIYNYGWQNAVLAFGERVFEPDGSGARLQNEKVQEAIEYAFSLNALNQNVPVSQSDFDEGRVAFSPLSYAEYKTYKPYPWKVKKFSRFDWTIIPMPSAQSHQASSSVDSLVMSMSSTTHHPDEAWDLLRTLCFDGQTQEMIMEYSQGLPSTRQLEAVHENSGKEDELDLEIVRQVMERSKALQRFPDYAHMISLLDSTLRSGYENAEDKDIFMIELQAMMDDALPSP